jgi:hypothetical protein
MKDRAKDNMIMGMSFLDSQTIIGDLEIPEQIAIEGYDYLVLPENTIEGAAIIYARRDIGDVTEQLSTMRIRVGGESWLRPEVVDELVAMRLKELRGIEEGRKKGKKPSKKELEEAIETPIDYIPETKDLEYEDGELVDDPEVDIHAPNAIRKSVVRPVSENKPKPKSKAKVEVADNKSRFKGHRQTKKIGDAEEK